MISLGSGHSVGYLTGPVAGGREGYYTGAVAAGEPPGRWYGAGAGVLGLSGEVDAEVMESIYSRLQDPRDPDGDPLAPPHRRYKSGEELYRAALEAEPGAGPERRAELKAEAERKARSAVSFVDATFSPAKSVTVLAVAFERMVNDARAVGDERAAQAWDAHRVAVEAAVLAGARASVDYLQDAAGYARVGNHAGKAGRWTDSHRWVVAQFLQHDSRDRDPQLHVHQAILNLQQTDTGEWRRLDTVAIRQQHHAAGAVGARVMEAELARTLGVRFAAHEDGHREVVGVSQDVMDMFSSRRRAISARAEELCRAYADRHGREPSRLERSRIAQQATLETRARKSHDGETVEARLDRWEREARTALVGGLSAVARGALDSSPAQVGEPGRFSPTDVVERAVATVSQRREKWLRADLMRAVSESLPANLGLEADQVRPLLESLTDAALERALQITPTEDAASLPDELRLADGNSSYARPGSIYFTTSEQVKGEQVLRDAAVERGAAALGAELADAVVAGFAQAGRALGDDQAAAVRGVLTSGARVEVLAAPAGTGKSFTVGALAGAWAQYSGHRVHGLAPSQVAAQVLTEEGLAAWNTTRWLNAQQRGQRNSDDPPALAAGDLVVVDEANMTSTADLATIAERVRAAGAKLLLVGDVRQLAAVGPGGGFADVAERSVRYELAEVRRFREGWEREASLGLRDGDLAALNRYDKEGRIVDGGTPEQAADEAARRWLADTLDGKESLLVVGSNDEAARMSGRLRNELMRMGRVSPYATVHLGRDGNQAGAGDLVQARHNAWDLKGWMGNSAPPINRETYRVLTQFAVGGLEVEHTRTGQRVTLPPEYVREHLTLAYASTVHAAEGRTVDTAHGVAGGGTDGAGLYVMATRGRESNTVYVVTQATNPRDPDGAAQEVERRAPRAVLAGIFERERDDRSALAEGEAQAEDARSTATLLERLAVEASRATTGRTAALLDTAAATGVITDEQRVAIAADPAAGMLDRLLREAEVAGHDPAAVLSRALQGRNLDDASAPAAVLHYRIRQTTDLSGQLESAHQLVPTGLDERWQARLGELADAADARRVELGQRAAQDAPGWAVEALGPVPDDPVARAEWEHRAGWAAAHRELVGHDDATDPLGAAPPAGLVEKHTMWRTAHLQLDLPDRGPDEATMSDGQLRCRITAWEREQTWAPRWVGDSLAATSERLGKVRADAALWIARVRDDRTLPDDERAQLRTAADQAEREAAELEQKVTALREADDTRAEWYTHTAVTRDHAERARAELADRGVDLAGEPHVTAEEWLAEHHAAIAEDELTREVTELDIDDTPTDADATTAGPDADGTAADGTAGDDAAGDDAAGGGEDAAEPPGEAVTVAAVPDVREIAAPDPAEHADPDEPTRRVPTVDEVSVAVERAREALREMHNRAPVDAARDHQPDHQDDVDAAASLDQWAADTADADQRGDAYVDVFDGVDA